MSTADKPQRTYVNLTPGDPAPWFSQRLTGNQRFSFDKAAGRYVVLCFFITAADAAGQAAIAAVQERSHPFDGERAAFYGVTVDPGDEKTGRVRSSRSGVHYFCDFDFAISRAYGAVPTDCAAGEANITTRRFWLVLDPALRVLKTFFFAANDTGADAVLHYIETLPPVSAPYGVEMQAPVLLVPNVFEPDVCRTLIETYEKNGGIESGFMREIDGKTAVVHDPVHKRRRDCNLEDAQLIEQLKARVYRRIVPEIARAHQFHVTRMERFLVACYSADEDGHFNQHRDNTTKGTAHRRFAVSLNLNDDYEGGELWFPEYGPRTFKPPPGAAVVFSCSLLHAAKLVTRGRRYVFLPFLYDEAAAEIRLENNKYLDASVGQYRR